jgi:hypothetical protein
VTTFFVNPLCPRSSCATIQVPRGNKHSSARSELKTGLADSRIETKLPIEEAGLLHVCLTGASDSHAGAMKFGHAGRGSSAPPVHMTKPTEDAGDHAQRRVHPDEKRSRGGP